MRTLLLMRHAKSDWSAEYGADHDRPLNQRGLRSARVMGQVLSREGLEPDLVISSTAVRARTTAEIAAEAGGWTSEIRLEPELYGADSNGVIAVARQAPSVGKLMLVGHQPTWSLLASDLTGEPADMKTATVAVVDCEIGRWGDLAPGAGRLRQVLQPREYLS